MKEILVLALRPGVRLRVVLPGNKHWEEGRGENWVKIFRSVEKDDEAVDPNNAVAVASHRTNVEPKHPKDGGKIRL